MDCLNCNSLLIDQERLGRAYAVALSNLTNRAGTCSREEYAVMRTAVEDARLVWEDSQIELVKHQKIHESAT